MILQKMEEGEKSPCGPRSNTRKPQPKGRFPPVMGTWIEMRGKKEAGLLPSNEKDYPEDHQRGLWEAWGWQPWLSTPPPPTGSSRLLRLLHPPQELWPTLHFPHWHLALVSSEHRGGERTCPGVKDAQLKIQPKLSGCSLGPKVITTNTSCTFTPKWATQTPASEDKEAIVAINQIKTYFCIRKQFLKQERNHTPEI